MTPFARVNAALSHQEPDRVPTALGGGPYGIVDELYLQLVDSLRLGAPVPPFRTGHSITYLDDRLFKRLGIDTRYVSPGVSPSSPVFKTENPDLFVDGFGQTWRRARPYYYATDSILQEATNIDDIDRLVTWPDVTDARWMAGVADRARELKENTDYYVVGRMVLSHGVFQTAADLRGTENFLIDLILEEGFAAALIARVTETIDGLLRRYLEAGGRYFDMIELPGDDYAGNQNLLISLSLFRKYFKPALAQFVRTVKEYRDDLKVMFHSDGMITPLLPELIEVGVDVVHPLEPVSGMAFNEIKEAYGTQISFLGGIDISQAMQGSRDDVVSEVRRRIEQLAPGGGYILAPSNHLQADVPVDNVLTLFTAARELGQYPLIRAKES